MIWSYFRLYAAIFLFLKKKQKGFTLPSGLGAACNGISQCPGS